MIMSRTKRAEKKKKKKIKEIKTKLKKKHFSSVL